MKFLPLSDVHDLGTPLRAVNLLKAITNWEALVSVTSSRCMAFTALHMKSRIQRSCLLLPPCEATVKGPAMSIIVWVKGACLSLGSSTRYPGCNPILWVRGFGLYRLHLVQELISFFMVHLSLGAVNFHLSCILWFQTGDSVLRHLDDNI